MARWIKSIDWSLVLHNAFKVACVIALFVGLILYLDKCSNDDTARTETARHEGYDEGYNVGYEAGRERGQEDVKADPRDYDLYSYDDIMSDPENFDLYSYDDMIDMLNDLFNENIPDDAYWYLNY